MSSPGHAGRPLTPGQGPFGGSGAPTTLRDRIADRTGTLDILRPDALDLSAEVIVALYDELHGRASSVAGHRSATIRQRQLRGEDALTIEDLAFLALEAPRSVQGALAILARAVGCALVPQHALAPGLCEAKARLNETHAALQAAIDRAQADGSVTPDEADAVMSSPLVDFKRASAQAEQALVATKGSR